MGSYFSLIYYVLSAAFHFIMLQKVMSFFSLDRIIKTDYLRASLGFKQSVIIISLNDEQVLFLK